MINDSRPVQDSNAQRPIFVTDSGIDTVLRETHPRNVSSSITSTPSGMVIDSSKEQFLKARLLMCLRPFGRMTDVNDEHPSKTPVSNSRILGGIFIELNSEQPPNACLPILSMLSCKVIDLKQQSSKAPSATDAIPSGITNDFSGLMAGQRISAADSLLYSAPLTDSRQGLPPSTDIVSRQVQPLNESGDTDLTESGMETDTRDEQSLNNDLSMTSSFTGMLTVFILSHPSNAPDPTDSTESGITSDSSAQPENDLTPIFIRPSFSLTVLRLFAPARAKSPISETWGSSISVRDEQLLSNPLLTVPILGGMWM